MYAIIATGGKQYKVEEGQTLDVELLHAEAGETVEIDSVLMLNKDGEIVTGKPYVEGAKVSLKVVENGKAPKIVVFKYKPKKNYRRKKGHRQPYTRVTVESIVG
ncbi:MAG: 50S ribosomal protein L21 [Peptococcaceae bacterium]|nr:50S ribosomal protein L21 [Peptococcaceae bacterium]MEE0547364.1 50S ribosomal protein L21 [Peptococcaceae bacterium]